MRDTREIEWLAQIESLKAKAPHVSAGAQLRLIKQIQAFERKIERSQRIGQSGASGDDLSVARPIESPPPATGRYGLHALRRGVESVRNLLGIQVIRPL